MRNCRALPCRRGRSCASTKPTCSSPSKATRTIACGSSSSSRCPTNGDSSPRSSRRILMVMQVIFPHRGELFLHAQQEQQRQEREAVRGAEGQGHVEGARSEDLELRRLVQPRRQEVRLLQLLTQQLVAGRHDCAEESSRPQGRQGSCAQVVTHSLTTTADDMHDARACRLHCVL